MDDRDSIISRLPKSEGTLPPPPYRLTTDQEADLWTLFERRLNALGGRIAQWHELSALEGRRWNLDLRGASVSTQAGSYEEVDVWSADVGLTMCDVAVAETGTLLQIHERGDRRLASIVPPHHVALVSKSSIVATLDEALDRLPSRNAVMITGPSRTADIEGVLVRGVHGPGDIWVILIEPEK